jgi:hypothetical protein
MQSNVKFSTKKFDKFINKHYIIISLTLISAGLIRLLLLGSSGNVDMEFWRAWMSKLERGNLLTIYSIEPYGLEFFHNLKNRIPVEGLFFRFEGIDPNFFQANWYSQKFYPIVQPPNFYFDLMIVNYFNNKIFNNDYVALNFINVIWTIILNFLIYLIFIKTKIMKPFLKSLLLIWVNPLILVNTVIQGFRDIYSVLFIVGSIILITNKKYFLAGIIATLGLMAKPQILFLFVIILVLIPQKKLLNYVSGVILTISLIIYIYFSTGYLYGLLASSMMVTATTKWYPSTISFFTPFTFLQKHQDFVYFHINTNLGSWINRFTDYLQLLSVIHLAGSILAVVIFRKVFTNLIGNLYSLEFFYLTLLIYMLRPNGQPNHYFAMSIFWLISLAKFDKFFWSKFTVLGCFLIQDLGYNGFGRNSIFVGTSSYYSDLIFLLSTIICIILVKDIYKYRHNIQKTVNNKILESEYLS